MARVKTQYKCRSCGYISASYLGRCPNCGAWNQFEKETEEVQKRSTKATASRLIQKQVLMNLFIWIKSRLKKKNEFLLSPKN